MLLNNIDELKNKLKVALFYEFYVECIYIEYKIMYKLIIILLKKMNVFVPDEEIVDFEKLVLELKINKNKNRIINSYISNDIILELLEWNICTKNICFQINNFSNLSKNAIEGKNLLLRLENTINLIEKNN